jgi:long-chain fatty acid transport protein
VFAAAVSAALLAPAPLHAGGLFAGDAGSQAQSRAGAFVAKADDPTALMHNPAGLVKAASFELFLGANLVHFRQSFDREGVYQHWTDANGGNPAEPEFEGADMPEVSSDNPIQPIPFIAGTQKIRPDLAISLGVFAPQGYPNRDFERTVTVNGIETEATPNRYDIVKEKSLAAFPSLAVAYRALPGLDVGARFSVGFSTLEAENNQWGGRNNQEDILADGVFTPDVADWFVPTFGLGVLYRPTSFLEFGAAYNSQANLDMKGEGNAVLGSRLMVGAVQPLIVPIEDDFVRCGTGGKVGALKSCLNVKIPAYAQIGGRYIFRDDQGVEQGDVELDFRWEQWSKAADIEVIVDGVVQYDPGPPQILGGELQPVLIRHGFEDVYSIRLGGSYNIPLTDSLVQLRGGASYDTAAAPVSWTRLDIDGTERTQLALGASYQRRSWKLDLGASLILSQARDVTGPDPFDTKYDNCGPLEDPNSPNCVDDIRPPDRTSPDATNPVDPANQQPFQPFNYGHYESGYVIVATGFTYMW